MLQSYLLWSNKKLTFYSLAIIFLSSCSFGLWFKIKQISIASEKILGLYPLAGYAVSSLKTLFIFSSLWLGLSLLISKVRDDQGGTALARNLFLCSLPFCAFLLSSINASLSVQILLFVLFCGILILLSFQNTSFWKFAKEPVCVLAFYLLCFFLILRSYSPLYHNTFWDTWGRNDFLINLEQQWENAKAYDFLGNFTQSGALGGHTQGVYMISELSALIILIFDLPIIDLLGKFTSVKFLYLGFYIFGTFGTYLFFRYGLKLSTLISTLGGLGFFWGNSPYLSFMAGEFPIHMVQFTFFPWILLFIKLAYSFNRPALSCLAGLVASLSEYAMSSHPESDFIYFIFCNLYNLYLALTQLAKSGLQVASVKRFFGWLVILPIFWGIGLAYRVIPMIGAILNKEFSIVDSPGSLGLGWTGGINSFQKLSTILFRFEKYLFEIPPEIYLAGASGTGGSLVYFFIGQPLLFFAFAFVCLTFVTLYKKILHKPNQYLQHTYLQTSLFFVVMYLFLSWNLPQGNRSWLSEFMVWTGFLRIHNAYRLSTYYFFFGLVTAMYGLNFLLHIKKIFTLNIIFLSFLTMLGVAYISPLYLAKPDKIFLDAMFLVLGYLLVLSHALTYQNKKIQWLQFLAFLKTWKINKLFSPLTNPSNFRNTTGIVIIGLTFSSFILLNSTTRDYLLAQNNPELKKSNIYIPERVSVTHLKSNQHDMASFVFLQKEIERFAYDFSNKRKKNLTKRISAADSLLAFPPSCKKLIFFNKQFFNKQKNEKHKHILKKLSTYMYLDPEIESLQKTLLLKEEKVKQATRICSDSLTQPSSRTLAKSENLKVLKTENGFLNSWEPKNISYIIKRSLNIFLDPVWRHSSIQKPTSKATFMQRRFRQDLNKVETIDLVFSSNVSNQLINYDSLHESSCNPYCNIVPSKSSSFLAVNLRLAGTALPDTELILPAYYLPTKIIDNKEKETTLRVHIGEMIKNYFAFNEILHLDHVSPHKINPNGHIYLKEIIFFLQDNQKNILKKLPLKRVDFLGLKTPSPQIDMPDEYENINSLLAARLRYKSSALIEPEDRGLKNMARDFLARRITNPLVLFVDRIFGFKPSWKPSWESPEKHMDFFNEIAPERDNFYYLDEPSTRILMHTQIAYHGGLTYNINNIPQFYFPDEYQLFLFLGLLGDGNFMPIGKKSELTAGMWFGIGPGYPSIDVDFHLESLFYKPEELKDIENPAVNSFDWHLYGVEFDQLLENPNGKKILNILGIDFLVFHKSYLKNVPPSSFYFPNPKMPTPSEKMEGLLSMGLVPFDLPESYKIAPKFPDHYGIHVLKNPESYGKAYIAKWVKTIKPEDNDFNKSIFELGMTWPKSDELLEHFYQHLSEIPDAQGAALIESMDADDSKINPQEYPSNSYVEIIKIIASKAVFDVNCKEDHCWLIYNTAALDGWKAYSGSEKLEIHKANLGFIGIKLDRGQHFVWMEYQPWLPTIGLLIALAGWIFTLTKLIAHRKFS